MKNNTLVLFSLLIILLSATVAACGIFNIGGTNEDGTPKTTMDARAILRGVTDGIIQAAQPEIAKIEGAMEFFDVNMDGKLTLSEIESQIDLSSEKAISALVARVLVSIAVAKSK